MSKNQPLRKPRKKLKLPVERLSLSKIKLKRVKFIMATTKKSDYGVESIVVLEGLEPVRKRPAMYIGTTSQYGINHCLNEIIDNSIDEALAGYCRNVEIRIEKNGYLTVFDDGRGIP